MIEHASIGVRDVKKAKAFYSKALAPLGYRVKMEFADAAGFTEGGHTSFWIGKTKRVEPTHFAFRAKGRSAVKKFHAAALKAGGKDNGAPGYRDYSPGYYAAFVHDADGNNIEAVWYDGKKSKK